MRPKAATVLLDQAAAVGFNGDIPGNHLRARSDRTAFRGDLVERGQVAPRQREHGPFVGELPRELRPDTLRGAGDDDDVVFQRAPHAQYGLPSLCT